MNTELVQSEQAWHALRDEWDMLLAESVFPSVFLSFDYLVTAFGIFHAENSEPFILTVRDSGGVLIGIAPFRRTTHRHWGGSHAVLEYLATWETDKPYLIVGRDREYTVWGAIFSFLDANPVEWDLLQLIEMPDCLSGAASIKKLFGVPGYKYLATAGPDGPIVDLTQSWEEFLGNHKNYRKTLNRLQQPGSDYEVITYDSSKSISGGIESYIALERQSWKHGVVGLEKNPLHTKFYQSIIPLLAEKERASIHFLVTGEGRKIAGMICCSFGQTLYVQHTVYDPDFSEFSPGKLLVGLVLKRYMDDPALTSADL